jgi:hypothetical protein
LKEVGTERLGEGWGCLSDNAEFCGRGEKVGNVDISTRVAAKFCKCVTWKHQKKGAWKRVGSSGAHLRAQLVKLPGLSGRLCRGGPAWDMRAGPACRHHTVRNAAMKSGNMEITVCCGWNSGGRQRPERHATTLAQAVRGCGLRCCLAGCLRREFEALRWRHCTTAKQEQSHRR